MSEVYSTEPQAAVVRQSEDLDSLRDTIKNALAEIGQAEKDKLGWARVIGKAIQKAEKQLTDQVAFVAWRDSTKLSQPTAWRYKQIAEHWAEVKECVSVREAIKIIETIRARMGGEPIRANRKSPRRTKAQKLGKQLSRLPEGELLELLQEEHFLRSLGAALKKDKQLQVRLSEYL